jgi:hypothetical protein
LLAANDKMAR